MYYTYVLQNKNGRWYTGYSSNLRKRYSEHNDRAQGSYTSRRGPYTLIYYEACLDEEDARSREVYLKTGMGKRYLKNRLKRFLSLTG